MIATLREHPAAVAQALTGRDYVSYSALSTYQQCPLRYYFRYVEGLPEETVSASLVFGGAIHVAVEHHFRQLLEGCPAPPLDDLLAVYRDAWREREGSQIQFNKDDDESTLAELAKRMLGAFQQSDLAKPRGTILAIEDELRGELVPGVPDLLARVDLLVDSGDELIVTDLKTARSRWSQEMVEDSSEQLLLYGHLVRQMFPGRSLRLEFGVITKAKTPAVDRHEVQLSSQRLVRTKHVMERIWRAISSGHFFPAPSPMNCSGCPFRKPCRDWGGS
ncbi:MAG: RecB family exonuclease [Pirellulaceae bacterium]